MADAKPSGPNYAVPVGAARPEPNHIEYEFPVRLANGDVVLRRYMANGNVQQTPVFAKDFEKDALTEEQVAKKVAALQKGAK